MDILDTKLRDIHSLNKCKPARSTRHNQISHKAILSKMEIANKAFDDYVKSIDDPTCSPDVIRDKLQSYIVARKAITNEMASDSSEWI